MRTTYYKIFTIAEHEKEEQWLQQMSAQGKALVQAGACRYVFEDCLPNEYEYKILFMDTLPGTQENQDYLAFLAEGGIVKVGQFHRWAYFRKKAEGAPFQLFSDLESEFAHIAKIKKFAGILFLIELFLFCFEIFGAVFHNPYLWLAVLLLGGFTVFIARIYFSIKRKYDSLQKELSIHQ